MARVVCSDCSATIPPDASVCPGCGRTVGAAPRQKRKAKCPRCKRRVLTVLQEGQGLAQCDSCGQEFVVATRETVDSGRLKEEEILRTESGRFKVMLDPESPPAPTPPVLPAAEKRGCLGMLLFL